MSDLAYYFFLLNFFIAFSGAERVYIRGREGDGFARGWRCSTGAVGGMGTQVWCSM
jgi:hypothetical protein